jgi:hypothetical protein
MSPPQNPWRVASLLMFGTIASHGQNQMSPQPCPDLSAGSIGCQLIVWSDQQEPPADPALLPDDTPKVLPATLANQNSVPGSATPRITVTGVVFRKLGRYFLISRSGNLVELDNLAATTSYQGMQVRITGVLDAGNGKLCIESVEPIV